MTQWLVFTDLDGTLLDAESYAFDAAQMALKRLQAAAVPVIFCSAKTAAEQAPLRAALNVDDPYIVENGSAIIMPNGARQVLGIEAAEIHRRLDLIRQKTGLAFQSFHEVDNAQVAEVTGLAIEAARRAQSRDYSATVFTPFDPAQTKRFQDACRQHNLKAPSGGRFFTVTGYDADKGKAVRLLCEGYAQKWGSVRSVGIGDSPNDAPLLSAVDEAFQVQRPEGTWKDMEVPGMQRIPAIGPAGWALVIERLLAKIDRNN